MIVVARRIFVLSAILTWTCLHMFNLIGAVKQCDADHHCEVIQHEVHEMERNEKKEISSACEAVVKRR